MKKKIIATLLTLVMVTAVVSGCGNQNASPSVTEQKEEKTEAVAEEENDTAVADEPVELTISWWGNDARAEYTQKLLEMYSAENPNVTFVATPSSWDGYWDKLATQIAGGGAPDIMQMDYSMISTYSENGSLADLQKFVDDGTIDLSNVNANLVDSGKVSGKLTGIAVSTSTAAIGYNPDVLEEAGLDIPTSSWTWDDFTNMCKTVKEKTGKAGLGNYMVNTWEFQYWIRANNAELYNADGTALGYEDDSIVTEWFDIWKKMVDEGGLITPDEWTVELGKSEEAQLCAVGNSAFARGSNTYIVTSEQTNDHLGLMTLPLKEGGNDKASWMKPGMFLSVSSTASEEKQREAAKFISWFINSEDAGAIIGTDRGMPASSAIRDALKTGKIGELSAAQKTMFDFADLAESISGKCPAPDPQGASEVSSIYLECVDAVLYGYMTSEEAAIDFRERANEVLARNAQ